MVRSRDKRSGQRHSSKTPNPIREKAELIERVSGFLNQGGAANIRSAIETTNKLYQLEFADIDSRLTQLSGEVQELLREGSLEAIEQALEKLDHMLFLSTKQSGSSAHHPVAPTQPSMPAAPSPSPVASTTQPTQEQSQPAPQTPPDKTPALGHKVLTSEDILLSFRDTNTIKDFGFTQDGTRIAVGTADGRIIMLAFRSATTLEQVGEFQGGGAVSRLLVHPQNPDTVVAVHGCSLTVVSFTDKFARVLGRTESLKTIECAAISPNGKVIAYGDATGLLSILPFPDRPEEELPRKLESLGRTRFPETPTCLDFCSADMRKLAIGGANGSCRIINLTTMHGDVALPELTQYQIGSRVTDISYRSDGSAVAVGTEKGSLEVLPLVGGARAIPADLVLSYLHETPVRSVSFHPREQRVAIGTDKGEMVIVSFSLGKRDGETTRDGEYSADTGPCLARYNADGAVIGVTAAETLNVIRLN